MGITRVHARRRFALGAVAAVAWGTLLPTYGADAAYSCANRRHNGVGADGARRSTNTNVNGVAGTFYVPAYTDANLYGQQASAADIALIIEDSVTHFFQIGWYVGIATGLPYTSTPRFFAGEGIGATGQETLTFISTPVPGGSWHSFKLVQDEATTSPTFRKYVGYIDGVRVWTSTMITTIEGTPRALGETNWDCADMYAHASTPSGGPTLQAHHANGTWSNWQEHLNVSFGEPAMTPGCWINDRVNGYTPTLFAYDVC